MSCASLLSYQRSHEGYPVSKYSNIGPVIDSDDDSSTPNSEKDEIPLLIPDIAPTIDNNGGDGSDDESSGQDNSEDGNDDDNDRVNGGKGAVEIRTMAVMAATVVMRVTI